MAQNAGTISIPISKVTQQLTVTVNLTGMRSFALRMKLAEWLFRLGARVAGFGIVIED